MNFKGFTIIIISIFLIFLTGCTKTTVPNKLDTQEETKENIPEVTIDPIKEKINSMSLDEKIGQLVLTGVDGYSIDENSKTLISTYHVGGIIYFKKNIENTNQFLTLINSLKETNSSNSSIPLFLGIDEEGGRVTRLPSDLKNLPTNKTIGKVNNETFSYEIGKILGEKLDAFGLNVNFAPVLDINSNAKNPVIGDRSFGNTAILVSKLGIQTMKGIQSKNIIAAVKHFPGHGDTSVDSHLSLPVVNNSIERLKNMELIPFAESIKNGADMVMVSHILLPKIDSNNPASFSKTIITDMLRKDLAFNGVIITDDMTMGAIIKNYNIGEAAVKSLIAGTDIVMVCHDYDKQVAVLQAIKTAVLNNSISMESIDEKVYRILKLKEKYSLSDTIKTSIDIKSINNQISNLLNTYLKH